MAKSRQAFTLIELLAVLAIIAILAGVLFPLFSTVKASARKATCIANFKQVGAAMVIYVQDYDDTCVLVNHQPAEQPNSRNDRTWVQLLLPYMRSFKVFQCPGDTSVRPTPEATFDQDLVPGDLYSQYYTASLRVNTGYNFQYLSPIVRMDDRWYARPKSMTSFQDPSRLIAFMDSVWSIKNGQPVGGGSWLVSPPCRYEIVGGQRVDSFLATNISPRPGGGPYPSVEVFEPFQGWDLESETSPNVYGGAWPWHQGRINVVRVDTSAQNLSLAGLTAGCDVLPNWEGPIYDSRIYAWNPH